MKPFIHIFGLSIPTYGLSLVVAAAVAWLFVMFLSKKKEGVESGDVSLAFLFGIAGGATGAYLLRPLTKLIEFVFSAERYAFANISELFNHFFGEIVFYGGLIGGLIAVLIYCAKFKIRIVPLFDIFAPALALAHGIGRIGCLLGGCCYGIEVAAGHPFAIVYPAASLAAPAGVPLLAVPLIEAVFLFALSIIMMIVFFACKKPGLCAPIYLLAYPIGRFILEFYRGDIIRGAYWGITTSQIISIALFVFGVVYTFVVLRKIERGNA